MRRFFLLLTLAVFLGFGGCRTTSTVDLTNRPVSSMEVQSAVRTHVEQIRSLQGEGRILVETPDIAQSVSFILTLRKPDSILVRLEGPFGIRVGSALITRSEFFFYNSLQNKLISGSSKSENLNRIFHVQLGFDDLMNFFSGGTFLDGDLRAPDETRIENGQYVFVYKSDSADRMYWIDPNTYLIRKMQYVDHSGSLILEQTFSKFQRVSGIEMPYEIRVLQPKTRELVALAYSDVSVNTESNPFTFTIPSDAERIRW
jgi:outer membrane lipoprotein-sorting protein